MFDVKGNARGALFWESLYWLPQEISPPDEKEVKNPVEDLRGKVLE